MAASLLAAEVWAREQTAADPVATKRMRQRLSLEVVAVSLAAELIPAYAPSTVERCLSSVAPAGRRNAACGRRAPKVVALASALPCCCCYCVLTALLPVLVAEAWGRNAVCTDGRWEFPSPLPVHCGAGGGTAAACCTADPAAAAAVPAAGCSQSAAHESAVAAAPAMLPAPDGDRLFLRGVGVAGGPASIDRPPRFPARAARGS